MKNISPLKLYLTYFNNGSEHRGVVHDGAVPPAMPELVLTLVYPGPRPPADPRHVVLVEVAQLGLAGGQAWSLAAGEGLRSLLYQAHMSATERT